MNIKNNLRGFLKDVARVSSLIWQADRALASVNIALQIVQALLPILSLYYIKLLIEAVVHGRDSLDAIVTLVIVYSLIQLVSAVTGQYAAYLGNIHQHKLTDSLSSEILEKAIKVDYEYYENPAYHDTLHLAQQQAIFKASQLLSNFNAILLNSLSLVFLIAFFFTLHSMFALLFIFFSVPLAIIKWYSGFAQLQLEKKFVPMEREANYLHQVLTGIGPAKEVRVFGYGEQFIQKFKRIRALIHKEKTQLDRKFMWYSLLAETGEIIAMSVIFALLAKYTWQRVISIGAFVIYIQGFQRLQSNSKNFLQALVQLFQQRLFLKDMLAFLDLRTGKTVTGNKPFPEVTKGIEVNNLSFTYPGTQRLVLNNISFQCKPGNIIAIAGENGSGKSTLVKLLARLYENQTGSIKIDSDAITDIDMADFREHTVFLFQDFEKYFLSIEENITLGNLNTEPEPGKIERAAGLSGAHSFIQNLGKGYKTRMGRLFKGSEQLSGGQWQKLALAHVFYKKAKFIVLDEPTSALDASAELDVFKHIQDEFKGQMVILITHRLYNLKLADHIYVLKEGSIEQEGSFDALINTEGQFKQLYDAQKL